ncbi:MAG: isoleucine--tRNA ligase [Chloroflexi bacterium]|nr:isoleucine--tRNA ligase [Chloroflexota bacterium]
MRRRAARALLPCPPTIDAGWSTPTREAAVYKPVPTKGDFPTLEHEILRLWDERQIFQKLALRNRGNDRFSFIDGPITANNPMGVHHAWGRTYKDLVQRYKAMKGFDQRYQNGFDCQGLWVEVEVERALGLDSKRQIEEYGLAQFADRCRERVLTYADVITQQSVRLGMWMDWPNSYYTMSDSNIEHIWHFLKRCHENGWLYKGWRAMPWCARCGTSLSQHELIGTDSYRDVVHPSVYVRLPIVDRPGEYFMVWTTTPWTLAANVALAVHPELDYARVQVDGAVYYLSAKTVSPVFRNDPPVLGTVKGADLVGWRYRAPFTELEALVDVDPRVVPWTDVGEEEGTGIVHIAPGAGPEDFELAKVQGLPVIVPIDENGEYYAAFGPLAGKSALTVHPEIVASLERTGMLHRAERIEHRYPTCWRCGQEIVFRAVSEWFISCEEIRPRMIEAARTVEWNPASAGKRMEDWLNNMGDWCISRKRYWGLPLPFYPCDACGTMTAVGTMDELRERAVSGLDQLRELHRPWIDGIRIRCSACGAPVTRITEVGDCWLDAGIVPFSTLGGGYINDRTEWARWYPAEWISEMREQIRLWFYSMLFMSVTLEERSPYRHLLTYEKLLDETGRPMHKSLGNAIWFDEAAERMGADVMRWLYAGQSLQNNLLFGYGPAEAVRRDLLTLWNVYSFYVTYAETEQFVPRRPTGQDTAGSGPGRDGTSLGSTGLLSDFLLRMWPLTTDEGPSRPQTGAAASPPPTGGSRTDRWILSQLATLVVYANDRLEAYDAAALVTAVDRFVDDLSNWYVRRSRRRFSRSASPEDREAAFSTLHACLVTLSRLVAPFIPFVAEEMYQNLVRSWDASAPESVHLTPYPAADASLIDLELDREMELARAIVTLARAARNEAGIRVRQPLPSVTIASEAAALQLSDELRREIADELNVKQVYIAEHVDTFARRVVRPNPRILGPRLGARFPEVARALLEGEYAIQADGSVRVNEHLLGPDEVSMTLESLPDQSVKEDLQLHGRLAVALDRTTSPELRAEGLAREIVHRVQTMRKDAGLSVPDRVELDYLASAAVRTVFATHGARIRSEIGAIEVRDLTVDDQTRPAGRPDGVLTWRGTLDGEEITLMLRRVP